MWRAIAIIVVLASARALACTCGWPGFSEAVNLAEVAFEGSVVETFETDSDIHYLVTVSSVFKGEVPRSVWVKSDLSSCGRFPQPGVPWIFMVRPEKVGALSFAVHGCDGSDEKSKLDATELAALGPGYPPRRRTALALLPVPFLALVAWLVRRRQA